jgi:hypothetical protein
MPDDELFFTARNGEIWACWLSGKPAAKLGAEPEVLAAMNQFLAERKPGAERDSAAASVPPPSPPPAPAPASSRPSLAPASPRVRLDRASPRHELTIIGRLYTANGSRDVTVLDLSESGCRFHEPVSQLKENTLLTIKIGPVGPIEASVRWCRGDHVGLQFSNPLYPSVLEHIRQHFDLRRP